MVGFLRINKDCDAQLEIYKKRRLTDVRYYLRGIDSVDIGNYFLNYNGSLSESFNIKRDSLIKKFLVDIKTLYNRLRDIDIEFAKDEDEVKKYISEFEDKLKQLLINFEKEFLNLYQEETGYEVKRNGISLKSLRVKIRTKEELKSLSVDELHKQNEFNGFIEAFKCIYTLTCMIKDKYEKLERFRDKAAKLYPVNGILFIKAIKGMKDKLDEVPYEKFQFAYLFAYYIDIHNIKKEGPAPEITEDIAERKRVKNLKR